MYILKYSKLVHMAEMQARASSPYELVPNILQYILNNLYLFLSIHIRGLSIKYVDFPHNSGSFQYFITKFL